MVAQICLNNHESSCLPSLGIYNEAGGGPVAVAAQRGGFVRETIPCVIRGLVHRTLAGHTISFCSQGMLRKLSGTSLGGKSRGRPQFGSQVGERPPWFEY